MEKYSKVVAQYVSVADAAIICSVSERTIRRLIYGKQIPARKIGRAVRIPVEALDLIGEQIGA
ncbi:helix-turn-helix domain-containing protein [Flaviflexus sp.]|uniref:helix-turn-helix domain-containing protein n=1 Tax=Flaviflexus sp. TaxID=1969482 RepID=UPI003F8E9227